MKLKRAVARLSIDTLGHNIGGFLFEALGRYMNAPILTNNKKFAELTDNYHSIDKVTQVDELVLINPNLNFYGGVPKQTSFKIVKLINSAKRVIVYITDPKLMPGTLEQDRKIPGSAKAMAKLCASETVYNYQTDFLRFYYATKKVKLENQMDKEYTAVYFGNRRDSKRQDQLNSYFNKLDAYSILIVGWEHEFYDSVPYTKDMWPEINRALVTPIIGDEKIHYSKSQITTRCYEPWFTTTIGLVSERFGFPYPEELITSPQTFVKDIKRVESNHTKYIKLQRAMLKEMQSKYKNVRFDLTKMKQL